MLKKTVRKIALLCLAFAVTATAFVGALVSTPLSSAEPQALEEKYSVGETVTLPDRVLSLGDKQAKAEKIVYYPDGSAMVSETVELSVAGVYTVEYRAVIDGKLVKETESFVAVDTYYSTTGSKTVVRYGEDESIYDTNLVGLNVALAENERFEINQVLDIEDAGNGDFLTFHVLPKTQGSRDAACVYITLTDIYDESNYLTVKVQSVAYQGGTYVYGVSYALASPCGQTLIAQDYSESERIHVNDRFGQAVYASFYGNSDIATDANGRPYGPGTGNEPIGLQYKAEERQLWISGYKGALLIADFDAPKYTQYLDGAWKGFTTGEVRVRFEAAGYAGSAFNFILTHMAGHDISQSNVTDNEKPVISVDLEGYEKTAMPTATVGETYPVFEATAFDSASGYLKTTARAYYGYGSDSAVEAEIKNGRVQIKREGTYAIVYTAVDTAGNKAEEVVRFKTGETDAPSVTLSGGVEECVVGEEIALAEMIANGGSGKYEEKITVEKDGKTTVLEGETFRPERVGEYCFTYAVTDITGRTASETKTLTVNENPAPVFLENAVYPKYLVVGQSYKFPVLSAYDYNAQEWVESKLFVNGNEADNPFTAETAGEYTVQYVAQTSTGSARTQDARVIAVTTTETVEGEELVALRKFFVADGFTVTQKEESIVFDTTATGDKEIDYIKALLFQRFELGLEIDPAKNNYARLDILLADAENPENTLTLNLINDKDAQATYYGVNGERTAYKVEAGGFYGGKSLKLAYKNGAIVDNGSFSYKIGDLFTATRYTLTLRLIGMDGESSVGVFNVNGQLMLEDFSPDNHKAQLQLLGSYPNQVERGNEIKVVPMAIEDIIDTQVRVLVTVETPSGDTLLDKMDATKSYVVTTDEYGVYYVEYTIYNYTGKKETYYVAISVLDSSVPVVQANGTVQSRARVGEEITLPSVSASDNLTSKDALVTKIFVVDPLGKLYALEGDTLKFAYAGEYTVRYFAQDEAGNVAIQDYKITVEG